MSRQHSGSEGGSLTDGASTMPSIYDTYLCRDPAGDVPLLLRNGPDEYTALLRTLQRSADHYAGKDQTRTVERLQFEMAKLHMENQQWQRAMRLLVPLWQTLSWRRSGWWNLLEELDWALKVCAHAVRDAETIVAVEWELLNRSLTPRQDSRMGFHNALAGIEQPDIRPRSVIRSENILPCISATFAFGTPEGNIGEPLVSQLVIASNAHFDSAPITLSQVRVEFEGGLKNVTVAHEPTEESEALGTATKAVQTMIVALHQPSSQDGSLPSSPTRPKSQILTGAADLTMAPGTTRVLFFTSVPREAEDVDVGSVSLCVKEHDFDLEMLTTDDEQLHQANLWVQRNEDVAKKIVKGNRSSAVKILPKPPKLQIGICNLSNPCYTDEAISFEIEITNEEEEGADVTLEAQLFGSSAVTPKIVWISDEEPKNPLEESTDHEALARPARRLGTLARLERRKQRVQIISISAAGDFVLEVKGQYNLSSDPETPVSKTHTTDLIIVQPFEANYSFAPLLHPDHWPNYFDIEDQDNDMNGDVKARGLTQRWSLTSRITSLATDRLIMESVGPNVVETHEEAMCNILSAEESPTIEPVMALNDLLERHFNLDTQKIDLEDRRSAFVDLILRVRWRREGSSRPSIISHLAVPELVVPFGEPRVLACAHNGTTPIGVIRLDYVIENPSVYHLTFNLTMDTSEEFAFSGSKNVTVQLVPLSRHTIRYNILPMVKGRWISPQFKVYDTHFRKTLKVSGTEGIRNDKKGVSIWVDADG